MDQLPVAVGLGFLQALALGSEADGGTVTSSGVFLHQREGGQGERKEIEDVFL